MSHLWRQLWWQRRHGKSRMTQTVTHRSYGPVCVLLLGYFLPVYVLEVDELNFEAFWTLPLPDDLKNPVWTVRRILQTKDFKITPQKWLFEHSAWYSRFISLLLHDLRVEDSSLMTFSTFQHSRDLQTKDFKVITSKVGTWTFCLVQQIYFTYVTWTKGRGFISDDILNIST